MTPLQSTTSLLGLLLGAGLWLVSARLPFLRRTEFAERISAHLRPAAGRSRLLPAPRELTPFGPLERVLRPVLRELVLRLNRISPAGKPLSMRLQRAGLRQGVLDFRAEQVLWAGLGLFVGGAAAVVLAGAGHIGLTAVLVLTAAGAVLGYLFRDYLLGVRIRRREARMLAEFPALAEMMALSVGAGESAAAALERIARTARGELAGEFREVVVQTRSGVPLIQALRGFSDRLQLDPLARFVDGVCVAMERGTPLGDVLRAQAQDVRDLAKRELMEAAGRKEIAMMVPLVFGVLPLTVLFAVFPGLALLRLGF